MTLETEMAKWNGRTTDTIQVVYQRHADGLSFLIRLIHALQRQGLQRASTRLLLMYHQRGKQMPLELTRRLFQNPLIINHWSARLNMLEILSLMRIPSDCVDPALDFLKECLTEPTILVQAWSYTAYRAIAVQHPHLQDEVRTLFEHALADDLPGLVTDRIERAKSAGFSP